MKLNKTLWIVLAILLVVVAAMMAIIPFERTNVWWIAAVCTALMFAVCAYSISMAFKTNGDTRSKLMGWPVFKAGYTMLTVQIVIGFILMAAAKACSWKIAVIAEIVVYAIAAIGLVVRHESRNVVEQSETKINDRTGNWKAIRTKANALAAGDPAWKKIAEDIRYADPTPHVNDGEIAEALEVGDQDTVVDLLNRRKLEMK